MSAGLLGPYESRDVSNVLPGLAKGEKEVVIVKKKSSRGTMLDRMVSKYNGKMDISSLLDK